MSLRKNPIHLAHIILIEGGGDENSDRQCRTAFAKLFEKETRVRPSFIPCGGRDFTYKQFKSYHRKRQDGEFVAMLIDSEITINTELCGPSDSLDLSAWKHLEEVPNREPGMSEMPQPKEASDNQVLFMTTCMETWIVADHEALKAYFHPKPMKQIHVGSLPSLVDLENRDRAAVQKCLESATKDCSNAYTHSGNATRAYKCLGELNPDTLAKHLPSFARVRKILNDKLNTNP